MPSPSMLGCPLTSFTMRSGPRLMPIRRASWGPMASVWARRLLAANRASSGSPRKQSAAPSPVSSIMRSATGTCSRTLATSPLSRVFSSTCFITGWFEYPTMSTKTTVAMNVRWPGSAGACSTPSALDHLHRLLEAPSHAIERAAEQRDLVPPALRELRDLEVAGADLVGRMRQPRHGPHDHPVQHQVEHDEHEREDRDQ